VGVLKNCNYTLREKCSLSYHKTGNTHINVMLWRVHVTVVAVEKQLVLLILSMCL